MKRIFLFLLLSKLIPASTTVHAQALICNDLVYIALDQNCAHTMVPEEMLEGTLYDNCVVEIDKTPPYGNGPWVAPTLGISDLNKTYTARVRHLPSGNMCWGSVTVQDKSGPTLQCSGLTTVNIANSTPVVLTPAGLAVAIADGCSVPGSIVTHFENNQTSLTLDCSDVGVNIIKVYATDQSGNTASCQTTVLVTEDGDCQACLSTCPAPVTVSFTEGYNTLRTAFLNNDWSTFDAYGNAAFNAACSYQDSTYALEFHPSTAGQSWFMRQWTWKTSDGQTVATCAQPILFPSSRTVTVQGKVYVESSPNCVYDAGEAGFAWFDMVATKLPGGTSQTVHPAADGSYALTLDFNILDSAATVYLDLPAGFTTVCPSALSVPYNDGTTQYTFDIGVQMEGNCPMMQVSLGANTARRCFANKYILQYCNIGLDTAYNAYVSVQLDALQVLEGATQPYTAGANNTYIFQLGAVPPTVCGTINLYVYIACNATLGQTLCAEATAWPNVPCAGPWTGPIVTASAHCESDSVRLAVWNKGKQDMTAPLDFIVIEDFIMYQGGSFQLPAGDSITVKVPANGSTWRIEAKQVPGFPEIGIVAAAIEGCGGLNTPGLITAFNLGENADSTDKECVIVTGSYDPNDKSAVPGGFGNDHIIKANEAIEYKIRFQNTGTDTAFRVVVVDTLSALLDPHTLRAGASSHPYRLDVYGGGILHFVFDPIALPDSNHNEAASHGFVQFQVAQKPDLPDGTIIKNTAAIYFDQNDPVVTNTVHQTIGRPYLLLKSQTPYLPGVQVTAAPNPFHDQTVLDVQGILLRQGVLSLYDAQGQLVHRQSLKDNRAVLERHLLAPGLYIFQITDNGTPVAKGRLLAQ